MSLEYIRRSYSVPAHQGARIRYTGNGDPRLGTITHGRGGRLYIRLDGDTDSHPYHPTWEIEYLPTPKDRP